VIAYSQNAMGAFDLVSSVQPEEGYFALVGIKKGFPKQRLVATRGEFDDLVDSMLEEGRDVYFGVAKFGTDENRTKDNVSGLKAFWLDIDCGPDKAAVNPTTKIPAGYATQQDGITALKAFCQTVGLPKPILVNSGRGVHVYWALSEAVTRAQWELVAAALASLCVKHKLYVDPAVFEVSRVLRVPNTLNFKGSPPTRVKVISHAPSVDFAQFRAILGATPAPEPAIRPSKRGLSALAKSMVEASSSSFVKILKKGVRGTGCAQITACLEDRETLSEPRWFDALSIAKFCDDRDKAIHAISSEHPDYNPAKTERKLAHIKGPHSCEEFNKNNPGICDSCPWKGKIKSPISLGKYIQEAKTDTVESPVEEGEEPEIHTIPKYPEPFFRGKTGGVYFMAPEDEDGEMIRVYENDFYIVKRMFDPAMGDVAVCKVHMPRDGVKEFVVPNVAIADKRELRKILAAHGVLCSEKNFNFLMLYVQISIKELQYKLRAEKMRSQFGWADKESRFIIGDREISKEGTYHSPPSSTSRVLAEHMQPIGTLEKWKEVFNLYGRPGLEGHAFAALTAFGSPLLRFLGQNGAIINVIHPSSGTGKTTTLHMCNSVYGHPERLCSMWNDTLNAKIMRLGIMNNLPFTVDEMTNMTPQDFSTLAYSMSQGRGKDRVQSSVNELRANLTSWQSISLCSSNAAFYEKMSSLKNSPDGELMRLIEYKIDYNSSIPADVAKHMFDHQLKENYGHAGDIYVTWLLSNMEEAVNGVLEVQKKIDKELRLTQRERFWSAILAANITGGIIAKRLGLIDWDMKAVYAWATSMIAETRMDTKPPAINCVSIVSDYILRHPLNILTVNGEQDNRTGLTSSPIMEPRGELLIRYEPDTKHMYFAARAFKKDCVEFQINYKETLRQLEDKGVLIGTGNKRMSKGMSINAPPTHCLIIDTASDAFVGVETILKGEK